MEFLVINHPNLLEVVMSGQFTFNYNKKFKMIIELLDTITAPALAVNLKDVEFIDSSGLGMLLLLRDECMKKNISITLEQPQGQVEKILTISKFDQLFVTNI